MILSLTELQALATKAARGGGMPWGLADEAGRYTRRLAEWGRPGADALAERLVELDGLPTFHTMPKVTGNAFASQNGPLCPIATGATLVDHAGLLDRTALLRIADTCTPLLLLPALADAARAMCGMFSATNCDLVVGPNWAIGDPQTSLTLSLATVNPPAPSTDQTRAKLSAQALTTLTTFAARTYAPATSASRARGAGDGT